MRLQVGTVKSEPAQASTDSRLAGGKKPSCSAGYHIMHVSLKP